MINTSFIKKAHDAFDELNYHEQSGLSITEFKEKAVLALNNSVAFQDAINLLKAYLFCIKKQSEIERIFSEKQDEWKALSWKKESLISADEKAPKYYITNAISGKTDDFTVSGGFKNNVRIVSHEGGKYFIGDDKRYYLKPSLTSAYKVKLFDSCDNLLCNIVINFGGKVYLEKNQNPYELAAIENGESGVFEKNNADNIVSAENLLATIKWDTLEKTSNYSLSRVTQLKQVEDNTLLLLFGVATLLLQKKQTTLQKGRLLFLGNMMYKNMKR